jgi:hypothetical protein
MRKLLILLVLFTGCTDAERARTFSLGQAHHVACFSGNNLIYDGDSTGQVQHGEAGYNFVDSKTHKLTIVSANCIITIN